MRPIKTTAKMLEQHITHLMHILTQDNLTIVADNYEFLTKDMCKYTQTFFCQDIDPNRFMDNLVVIVRKMGRVNDYLAVLEKRPSIDGGLLYECGLFKSGSFDRNVRIKFYESLPGDYEIKLDILIYTARIERDSEDIHKIACSLKESF